MLDSILEDDKCYKRESTGKVKGDLRAQGKECSGGSKVLQFEIALIV